MNNRPWRVRLCFHGDNVLRPRGGRPNPDTTLDVARDAGGRHPTSPHHRECPRECRAPPTRQIPPRRLDLPPQPPSSTSALEGAASRSSTNSREIFRILVGSERVMYFLTAPKERPRKARPLRKAHTAPEPPDGRPPPTSPPSSSPSSPNPSPTPPAPPRAHTDNKLRPRFTSPPSPAPARVFRQAPPVD